MPMMEESRDDNSSSFAPQSGRAMPDFPNNNTTGSLRHRNVSSVAPSTRGLTATVATSRWAQPRDTNGDNLRDNAGLVGGRGSISLALGGGGDEEAQMTSGLGNSHRSRDDDDDDDEEAQMTAIESVQRLSEDKSKCLAIMTNPFTLQLLFLIFGAAPLVCFACDYYAGGELINASDIPWPDLLVRAMIIYMVDVLQQFSTNVVLSLFLSSLGIVAHITPNFWSNSTFYKSHEKVLALYFKIITTMANVPKKASLSFIVGEKKLNARTPHNIALSCICWILTLGYFSWTTYIYFSSKREFTGMTNSALGNGFLLGFQTALFFLPYSFSEATTDDLKEWRRAQWIGNQYLLVLYFFDICSRFHDSAMVSLWSTLLVLGFHIAAVLKI